MFLYINNAYILHGYLNVALCFCHPVEIIKHKLGIIRGNMGSVASEYCSIHYENMPIQIY